MELAFARVMLGLSFACTWEDLFFTKEGETIVLKDDGSKEILAQNKLSIEGRVYGYAVADSKFVLRTGSELICLGGLN
jgi:hypothetical protein